MRKFRDALRSLAQEPLGFRGERPMGLGLAAAQAKAADNAATDVENYLRAQARQGRGQEVASS